MFNNNNNLIFIAPYGHNFKDADGHESWYIIRLVLSPREQTSLKQQTRKLTMTTKAH